MALIEFTDWKKQSVLMHLLIYSQQKEIRIVTTTTGGQVSIAKVGLPAITDTT
jgi:hypothetical protein